jgi:pimeloyl-ACP methyl ester carboxylesterase
VAVLLTQLGGMKRLVRWLSILVLLVLAGTTGTGMWLGGEVVRPARRALQPHHREMLAQPEAFGMRLQPFIASDGTPVVVCEPTGTPGKRGRLVREQLAARHAPLPRFGECDRVLVLVHGRRMRKEDMFFVAERFCAAGFRCIIPDLPGHGDHPAEVAGYGITESELPAKVAREAAVKFGFSLENASLLGISMGGAVAVRAATLPNVPWKALVLLCTFDDLASVVETQAGKLAGPVLGPLLAFGAETRFAIETGQRPSAANSRLLASKVSCHVLIAHGTGDSFIPPECGQRLHEALTAAKSRRWLPVPGAGHATIFTTDFPLFATLSEWLLREMPQGR